MLVTLIGISTEVKPEELKALVPIPVKLSGSLMEAKLEQEKYLQLVVFQFVLLKTVEKWLCRFCGRRK